MKAWHGLCALSIAAAAGCSSAAPPLLHSIAVRTYKGLPSGIPGSDASAPRPHPIARIVEPDRLALATFGSGSCSFVPVKVAVSDRTHITISITILDPPLGGACTADQSPSTSEVSFDNRTVDIAQVVHVHIEQVFNASPPSDAGSIDAPPYTGP